MELKELMSAFAETLGIEGIEVKDGVCSMTIDDIPMEFTESPDGLAVVGAAAIGEPPPATIRSSSRGGWRRCFPTTGGRISRPTAGRS